MRQLIILAAFAASFQTLAAEIEILNATVRQPLPGRTVSAGYFSIQNQSNQQISVMTASSPWFEKVELHQHRLVDGMMRMASVDSINIPASQTVHLQPGGLHLMLFKPKRDLQLDQQVPIELQLADGHTIAISAVVTKIPKQ
jgi:copper(I)-binding protein